MQLTKLELSGFKSFANRETLIFDKGITGIVGPNGCGKSNIVDAIRWVLGEQRSKNLRSDKMENVIFNGTSARRKGNVAEVSLTFENTKNLLPTEYSTVTITRKLYRSGESGYLINGVTCRLKDIHNLFMDTGISSDSYAIIELGMVDEILTNKDNERRKFFEEAAGISKYKIRKRQTLKRLKDTEDDLERVNDLIFEIEKQLKSLEKQARRTQRYFELKEQYKVVSSQFAYLHVRAIREKQQQLRVLETQVGDEIGRLQANLALHEARIQELKKELIDHERNLAEAQAALNQHLTKIRSLETEKSIKHERLKYLQQRETAVRNQRDTERSRQTQNQSSLVQLQENHLRQAQAKDAQLELEQQAQAELDQLKRHLSEQQTQLDSFVAQQRAAEQEVRRLQREQEIRQVKVQSLTSELQRTQEDRSRRAIDLDAFAAKKGSLQAAVSELSSQAQTLEERRDQHTQDVQSTEKLVNELKDKVYKTNRLIDAKQNEYNLTKSLVENLEGFPASVKFLKKQAAWMKQAPLLSDVFAVPETVKVAFENYLESYLSYYVVPTRDDALKAVHLLSDAAKGRANFFILSELDSYQPQAPLLFTQAQAALEVIDCAPDYKKLAAYLLDKVYLVRSESEIPAEIPEGTVFLTQAGNLAQRRFMLSGGSLGLFEGKRLGRAKNLEKLEKDLVTLQDQKKIEKRELEQATKRLDTLKRTNINEELEQIRQHLGQQERDLSVLVSREEEYTAFISRVGQRSEALEEELNSLQKQLGEIGPALKNEQESLQQLSSQAALFRGEVQEGQERVEASNRIHQEANIKLIHLNNEVQNLQREIAQKESAIDGFVETDQKLLAELNQVETDIQELINSNLQDDEHIVRLYKDKKEFERRVGFREEQVALAKNAIRQQEDGTADDRKKREDLIQRQQHLKDQATEIRLDLNSLKERLAVEFQLEIDDLQSDALFERPAEAYSLDELQDKVQVLRAKVQTFGEINPMAVEAYQEIRERYDFITTQKNDLLDAKLSLMDTISEIDQTAREKFLATFTEVRENFMAVFKSLFYEEDNCDLILMDPENPLESEINIIARPKGKRPLTIKQLSGGEKTLTAIALLFAIYLIKPAPFCVFDEVDAPLDDANIDKFNNIIRDFSNESQFIIVTHNKRTMVSTSVLYGVTMQNQGVSSVLPVSYQSLNLDPEATTAA